MVARCEERGLAVIAHSPLGGPRRIARLRRDGPSAELNALRWVLAVSPSVIAIPEHAVCTHPGGPPVCWCRPPLPGLLLEFARREHVSPEQSIVVGETSAHQTLAKTLGARFVPADL